MNKSDIMKAAEKEQERIDRGMPYSDTETALIAAPLAIEAGGGAKMFIPFGDMCWQMRYVEGEYAPLVGDCKNLNLKAASVLDSYKYLLSDEITLKEATRRLRIMRRTVKEQQKEGV